MKEKVEGKKKRGCLKALPFVLVALIAIIIALVLTVPACMNAAKEMQKYTKLVQELNVEIKDSDMADAILTEQDKINFQEKINNFIENKNGKSLFDGKGNFIKENLNPSDINFKTSRVSLNKYDVGCFANSLLGAGWIDLIFDKTKKQSFFTILEVFTLHTNSTNETTLKFVCKIDVENFVKYLIIDKKIDKLPKYIYFVYTTTFSGSTIESSSMQINKLSQESNDLLINLLFGNIQTKDEKALLNNLNQICQFLIDQINVLKQNYNVGTNFADDYFKISKNLT